MTKEEIREAMKAVPFVPFDLRLADGTIAHVPTSDHAFLSPLGRTLTVYEDDDRSRRIDTALVLEIIQSGVPPGKP